MDCKHEHIRCTNGIFYCLDCGAKIDPPKAKETAKTEDAPKRKKKGTKE